MIKSKNLKENGRKGYLEKVYFTNEVKGFCALKYIQKEKTNLSQMPVL